MRDNPDIKLDAFTEVVPHEDSSVTVFRVVRPAEGSLVSLGQVLTIDPAKRDINYRADFVISMDQRYFLAGLGPRDHRPKDGPRGLHLCSSFQNDEETDIRITPETFEQLCLGQVVGKQHPNQPKLEERQFSEDEVREQQRLIQENMRAAEIEKRERERAARAAARKAGWRAPDLSISTERPARGLNKGPTALKFSGVPTWLRVPEDIDVRAPVGSYEIDEHVRRLLKRGRVSSFFTDEEEGEFKAFIRARGAAIAAGNEVIRSVQVAKTKWPQDKADARKIASRIQKMIEDMDGFLAHVDDDQISMFVSTHDEPPEDEDRPDQWLFDMAGARLDEAREAVEQCRAKLEALCTAVASRPTYSHDGAKDIVVAVFLHQMAFYWRLMTHETPGKTGNGLFHNFCSAGWSLLG